MNARVLVGLPVPVPAKDPYSHQGYGTESTGFAHGSGCWEVTNTNANKDGFVRSRYNMTGSIHDWMNETLRVA